jgi:hypothetical protein
MSQKVSKLQSPSPKALKACVVHVKISKKVVFVSSPTEATARISRLVTSIGKITGSNLASSHKLGQDEI